LNAVRLHGEDFPAEQARIDSLTALSDSAVGRMQAVQTGNMIAAEQVQQLVKLRQLVMAQVNAQNVYMASQANREAQRAATQSEWVRNGNADAPRLDTATSTLSARPKP
jgi:type IV secretion system protein TrbJ